MLHYNCKLGWGDKLKGMPAILQILSKFFTRHCCFIQLIITVKPLLSGHLQDLPKCPLYRGCPLNEGCKNCAMFVNDQHSTVTLYCDKVACC